MILEWKMNLNGYILVRDKNRPPNSDEVIFTGKIHDRLGEKLDFKKAEELAKAILQAIEDSLR